MLQLNKEKTQQQRLLIAQKMCQGRHPDIHKAIEEVYAKDDGIKSYGNSWMYSPSDSNSHEAVKKIAEKFAKKNHKKLAELNQQLMDARSEMSQYETVAKQSNDLGYELQSATRMTWKDLAKKLGLHQYMTGSGVISQGKMVKLMQKQGKEAVTKLFDTYNTKYVPEINRLAKEINEEAKKGKDLTAMKEATEKYNQCVHKVNAIRGEIHWWSGLAPLRNA
jgi:hypothetical protein